MAGASAAAVYGIGDVPERVHEFIVFRRTQTRDPGVRLHLRGDADAQRWRVADDLPVQEPAGAAAWILDHGEGDPAHVGQLMREAIATGLADPCEAALSLAPDARRWNVHVETLLGEVPTHTSLHGAFTIRCCKWDMIAWLTSQRANLAVTTPRPTRG